nr:regulator of G-protein signaling 22 isoform X1 [Misgurnus anguillicaudatus]
MYRAIPDLPEITSDNFEEHLTSDQTFVDFFNDFLLLPVFGVAVRYDRISAGFELLNQTAEDLSCRIRSSLHELQSKTLSDPNWLPPEPVQDNRYTVTCLDRDQTIQWLKRDRLSLFLQSDTYFEYRLAKCLSQLSGPERPEHHKQLCEEFCSSSEIHRHETIHQCTAQGRVKTDKHNPTQQNLTQRQTPHSQTRAPVTRENGLMSSGVHGARERFVDFKRSLVGGQGEKILGLWMDVERLKTLNTQTKSRYLVWMKSQYVYSSSSTALNVELLSRLRLNHSISWQFNTLIHVQSRLLETLILYWGQRFTCCLSDHWPVSQLMLNPVCMSTSHLSAAAHVPFSVCADTAVQRATSTCTEKTVDSSEMASLMDVLLTEPRSGFTFTHFCQNSGNQLWENAVHFCSELLQYIQLFCMTTFDPYRVQHTAQLLYSSYLCSGAQMSIELSEENRKGVLARLSPAFEDLFDQAEEHALTILLEPWTLFSAQLTESLKQVALRDEVRYAETELYQMLQNLYTHAQTKNLRQVLRASSAPAEVTRAPDLWSKVPLQFRGLRLHSFIQNHSELQLFLSFLEKNSASMDLQYWLDVEQLKKTPASDEGLLEERHSNIRAKYFNNSFLFAPSSPASEEEQMRLLQMSTGLVCVSVSVSLLTELQFVVQKRLEDHWLPLFLSNSHQFNTHHKLKSSGVMCEQQPVVRHKRRRQFNKQVNGGVMASSQVSVSLRKALLNPLTCLQFQKFLSVCGDLLENDLLFWLEVQRYKDLCHSHCDDVTVQRKISIIISCFISSSAHPTLQIHIPPELAERITNQRRTLGPYVFREAQMCVFNQLLTHWPDFVALRTAVGEKEVLRVLEENQWRERDRRETGEQDDRLSEDDEPHTFTDEGLMKEDSGIKEVTYKISWCYSKHMAALEHETTRREEVMSSCGTDRRSGSSLRLTNTSTTGQQKHRNNRLRPNIQTELNCTTGQHVKNPTKNLGYNL